MIIHEQKTHLLIPIQLGLSFHLKHYKIHLALNVLGIYLYFEYFFKFLLFPKNH